MPFTHELHDEPRPPTRRESWHAEIAGYRVTVARRDDGATEVRVSPVDSPADGLRPLVSCRPTCVADLERVADILPEVIRAAAAELRAAGLDDLRSTMDVLIDEQRQLIDATLAQGAARRADGAQRNARVIRGGRAHATKKKAG